MSRNRVVSIDTGALLSAAALNAEKTSDAISTTGYGTLTLFASLTHDSATEVQIAYDFSYDGSAWFAGTYTDASTPAAIDEVDDIRRRTVAADDAWCVVIKELPTFVRIRANSTSGTASDELTVYGQLSST